MAGNVSLFNYFPGSYVLQSLLGNNFQVLNCGVGGENSLVIAGRQGGIPMLLAHSIELPADTTEVFIGNKNNSFISSWNNRQVHPLLQGEGANTINICTINSIECILRWTGTRWDDPEGTYTIRRATSGNSSVVLKEKSIIITAAMKQYRDVFANVFFMGENYGGHSSSDEFIAQYRAVINYSFCKNFVILGLTSGSKSERNELETLMAEEFGDRYKNLGGYDKAIRIKLEADYLKKLTYEGAAKRYPNLT